MTEYIDPGDVGGPKRCALRPADSGPGHGIDLFDGVVARFERAKDLDHPEQTDVIRNEVGRVLGDDDAFTETHIRKGRNSLDNGWIRVGGRNDLQKVQIARGIEEMSAEPMTTKVRASSTCQDGDRYTGCVRRDDGAGASGSVNLFEQRLLDLDLLDHGFDDPVDFVDSCQVAESARLDPAGPIWGEKRVRLQRPGSF